jgi:tol-pal system protein YbgF
MVLVPLVAWLGAGATAGCAHEGAAEGQVTTLRAEIARVQSERDDVEERLRQLELKTGGSEWPPASASSNATPTPPLRVVRLAPSGAVESHQAAETAGSLTTGDAKDPRSRTAIRVIGAHARVRPSDVDDAPPTGSDEAAEDDGAPAPEPRPSAMDPAAQRAYDAARKVVVAQNYDQALDDFAAFILRWPDHPRVGGAMYWRGECYFAKGDYTHAAEQFDGVIARFPHGDKAADCHLKLGICNQKLGQPEKAKWYFDQLAQRFPRSEAARRIPREEKP